MATSPGEGIKMVIKYKHITRFIGWAFFVSTVVVVAISDVLDVAGSIQIGSFLIASVILMRG